MSSTSTGPEFFEALYQRAPDPWNFASSRYELGRYSAIIASLKLRRFERAFEAGCSIGVLTRQLAAHCTNLLAIDVSVTAVSHARERCRDLANVDIQVSSLLTHVPERAYDLIVLSEIGYYFKPRQLRAIGMTLSAALKPGGIFLCAHWLGYSGDHIMSGDRVHQVIDSLPVLDSTFSERHDSYRIDHWTRG